MNSITFSEERNEETCYGYCNEYQPHAVKRMFDYKGTRVKGRGDRHLSHGCSEG